MTDQTAMQRASADIDKRGTKNRNAASTVKDLLERALPEIRNALPRHMTPERMIRIAFSAISRNPMLLSCEPMSLAKAVIESSELGLEPSGILGHAYLVPFKNNKTNRYEAQLQIGYRGFLELASRSGRVQSINAEVVYEGDEFDFMRGTEEHLRHKPAMDRPDNAPAICAYAVVRYKDGGVDFEVVTRSKLEQTRKSSKSAGKGYGPWETHFEEMARKTAIRRLAKRLPLSPELTTSAVKDEYREAGMHVTMSDVLALPDAAPLALPGGDVIDADGVVQEGPAADAT